MVVYDSVFGNTEKIAQAIGAGLGAQAEVEVCRVGDVRPDQLMKADLLIVGSPTRGFRPTPATTKLLKGIAKDGLKNVMVAGFDTRFSESQIAEGPAILAGLVKIFGYAAEPISKRLATKGGRIVAEPAGFIVTDTEGPLRDGELELASDWARRILEAV